VVDFGKIRAQRNASLSPVETVTTGVTDAEGREEDAVQRRAVGAAGSFTEPTAFVEVSLGLTFQLAKKYEMARVDVRCRQPCKVGDEKQAYKRVHAFVSKRIREEWSKLRGHADAERDAATRRRKREQRG
jgi:hypothetical protein